VRYDALPFETVEEFAKWWLSKGGPIRPPFKNPIFFTEMTSSLCIYRVENFQIELYIVKPNMDCPFHSHPGVDSLFMYLTGNLQFGTSTGTFLENEEYQVEGVHGAHKLLGAVDYALDGSKHAVKTGKEGGSYLSFEKWNLGSPDSVAVNWIGDTVGNEHTSIINK
jgi:hypothetical protein